MGFFNDPSISQIEFLVRSDISSSKKSKTCGSSKPGRWRNGGAFVFCAGDCPFKSEPTHTSADACEKVTGCDASYQEVGRCRTEVDPRECTLHSPLQKQIGRTYSDFET